MTPGLVALDWGTTACRAYLLDDTGTVLARRTSQDGVATISRRAIVDGHSRERAFEDALVLLCGDWLARTPGLPVLASGMVGSDQGWQHTPYLPLPVELARDDVPLTAVRTRIADVHLLPGVTSAQGALTEVARGEETQALGVLLQIRPADDEETVLVLPGTHSKWLRARGTRLTSLATALTGELYAALLAHTVLGHDVRAPQAPSWSAFDRGLDVAWDHQVEGTVLTLFSARALVVTGQLPADDVPDYLSGLLVGAEIAGIARAWLSSSHGQPVVVGEPHLQERYVRALTRYGTQARLADNDVTAGGLHHVAVRVGLVPSPTTAGALP
ncbi:2-dehydro-3-deoxygalactonokinase [Cellulosimicrobium sp. ES-005]|uniref:2-dehydro-3-deoxygalactonokinase n=1 Tax=Cellulosimicrobium sp. ES-005 TaxID=3163031 RepID=A0AAU8G5V2_9MICO